MLPKKQAVKGSVLLSRLWVRCPCRQRGCGKYPQGCGQPAERGSQLG